MNQRNLTSPEPSGRFQFRLATLFVFTTILCLHFAMAAYDPSLVFIGAAVSGAAGAIYIARWFRIQPAEAGACAIFVPGIVLGLVGLTIASISYLTPRTSSDPIYGLLTPKWIFRVAGLSALFGSGIGFCIAIAYWAIAACLRQLEALRTIAIHRRTSTPTLNPSSTSARSSSPESARSESTPP